MKITFLTSSRADYGIYRPLVLRLREDSFFSIRIIAFGTHGSPWYGRTVQQIEADGLVVEELVENMVLGDSPEAIATAMGLTTLKFAALWNRWQNETDLLFCLGDRYEMLAAVLAAVPFGLKIAHLHGGETTLGAIDNVFRHSLTQVSDYHFTATAESAAKVKAMRDSTEHVYPVGALSLDNLIGLKLLTLEECFERYGLDLSLPTILFTFHPETVAHERNAEYAAILSDTLAELTEEYQILVTLPNADTASHLLREMLLALAGAKASIVAVESLGTLGYFSCMQHCAFLLGNTSSGIIEAASLGKYVINLGNRQQGRTAGENVLTVPIQKEAILTAVERVKELPSLGNSNLYGDGHTAERIIQLLKERIAPLFGL